MLIRYLIFFLMIRRPPRSTLTDTLFPYTTLFRSAQADYELRWFTPAVEVALCGHATLASGHALMEGDSVRFLTRKAGILAVRRIGPGYELDLPAWESVPKALPDIVAGMRQEPAKTLWREGGYGLLVYEREAQVRAFDPDLRMLRDMGNILILAI